MKALKHIISICAVLALSACSDDNPADSSGSGVDTGQITNLPKATSEVVSGGAGASLGSLEAVTGLALKSWGKSSQWTGKSRAMCETGQNIKDGLQEAMQPDKILCYVGAIQKAGGFGSTTIDDGEYVHFKLTNMPDAGAFEPRIKMKIVKSGGAITTFEMFSCFTSDGGGGVQQSEYLNQTISGGEASITSKYVGSEGGNSFGSQATVTGTVNSSYEWLSKEISLQRFFDGSANSFGQFGQKYTITQAASNMILDGYSTGTFGSGASTNRFTNIFYSSIQTLNASTPKDMALGDGSSKFNFDWCIDTDADGSCADEAGGNRFSGASTESWDGDTLSNLGDASAGDFFSDVNSATLASNDGIPSVSFGASETWDCAASSFVSVDLTDMEDATSSLGAAFAACDAKFDFREDDDAGDGYACGGAQ